MRVLLSIVEPTLIFLIAGVRGRVEDSPALGVRATGGTATVAKEVRSIVALLSAVVAPPRREANDHLLRDTTGQEEEEEETRKGGAGIHGSYKDKRVAVPPVLLVASKVALEDHGYDERAQDTERDAVGELGHISKREVKVNEESEKE